MASQDKNGWGQVQLARALAYAGRYQEAVQDLNAAYSTTKSWASDPYFCARYAALMSSTNQPSLVADWLTQAYKDGFTEIAYVRTVPDFSNFQIAQPRTFARLTNLEWSWKVDFGVFNDDVIVQNGSPFALTNVTVQVSIHKGGQVWNRQMKCASIDSGGSCKAEDTVSIPGSAFDEGDGVLTSDQGFG